MWHQLIVYTKGGSFGQALVRALMMTNLTITNRSAGQTWSEKQSTRGIRVQPTKLQKVVSQ